MRKNNIYNQLKLFGIADDPADCIVDAITENSNIFGEAPLLTRRTWKKIGGVGSYQSLKIEGTNGHVSIYENGVSAKTNDIKDDLDSPTITKLFDSFGKCQQKLFPQM